MTANPYQPPHHAGQPATDQVPGVETEFVPESGWRPDSVRGPWRDGKRLVLRVDRTEFPPICLQSLDRREVIEKTLAKLTFADGLVPRLVVAAAVSVLVFYKRVSAWFGVPTSAWILIWFACAIMIVSQFRVYQCRVPCSRQLHQQQTRGWRWAGILIGALLLSVPLVAVSSTGAFRGMVGIGLSVESAQWTIVLMALLLLPSALTILFLSGGHRALTIDEMIGDFVWVRNVHPGFLEQLPELSEEVFAKED